MSKRREFSAKVRLEIIRRATDAKGNPRCERCKGVAIGGEVHHVDMDAMQIDKSGKLSAASGLLLCKPCHKAETAKQAPALAKAKRLERRAAGVRTVPVQKIEVAPMPVSERTAAKLARGPKASLPPRALYR